MSNLNEYVTHGELNEILSAIGEMFERSENRMMAFIENGVQKQVNALGEAVEQLTVRQTAMENQLGLLTESVQETHQRLDRVEERLDGVEERLDGVEQRLDGVEQRLDGVEQRLDGVEQRLDGVEQRLSRVEDDVKELKADVQTVKEIVSEHDEEIITLRRVK